MAALAWNSGAAGARAGLQGALGGCCSMLGYLGTFALCAAPALGEGTMGCGDRRGGDGGHWQKKLPSV